MELNQKLAEWAGWYDFNKEGCGYPPEATNKQPRLYPIFTSSLDACFKWLVPEDMVIQFLPVSDGLCCNICLADGEWYSGEAGKKEYALALCLAIEKLIDSNGSKD